MVHRKEERIANRWWAAVLAMAGLWIARLLAADIQLLDPIPRLSRLPLQFSLALRPLIYFYVLKVTQPVYTFKRKALLSCPDIACH